jgi:pilus assembly protein Flp/PilA
MMEQLMLQVRCRLLLARHPNDEGQGLIEYALIVILISIVVILVLGVVGGEINGMFESIVDGFGT